MILMLSSINSYEGIKIRIFENYRIRLLFTSSTSIVTKSSTKFLSLILFIETDLILFGIFGVSPTKSGITLLESIKY